MSALGVSEIHRFDWVTAVLEWGLLLERGNDSFRDYKAIECLTQSSSVRVGLFKGTVSRYDIVLFHFRTFRCSKHPNTNNMRGTVPEPAKRGFRLQIGDS